MEVPSFLNDWIICTHTLISVIISTFYKFLVVSEYSLLHKLYRLLLAVLKVSET